MKYLLFFICVASALTADEIQYLKIGKPHRILGHKVRVRAEAKTSAKIITELSIGSEVIPVQQTKVLYTQDGVEAPWYKISLTHNGNKTEGYVWGNLIAKSYATTPNGLVFLSGIGRGVSHDPTWTEYSTQMRVAKDGKELARLEIKEGVGFMSGEESALRDGTGFDGVKNIFSVHFLQEYCGGKGNKLLAFWTGKNLVFVHSTVDGSDAPYYAREQQIFPNEKGGKKNHLYIIRETGEYDDPKTKKTDTFWLKWTGNKLEKAP